MIQLEVCVDRIEDAIIAANAGATRIEMNQALQCDGLTPSLASCHWLVQHCPVPVVAMLRPHARGFCYSAAEKQTMLDDCQRLLDSGMAGIVCGATQKDGGIEQEFTSQLVRLCTGKELVYHRAFDTFSDQLKALNQLIELGVDRVLTSGGAATALAGVENLRKLQELSEGRIEILPGAGVGPENAIEILQRTGCLQLHGSFRSPGAYGPCADRIHATRSLLDGMAGST
jgi:copper homeostasis protein